MFILLRNRLDNAMAMMDKVYEYDPGFEWVLHLGDIIAWEAVTLSGKRCEEKYFKKYMWAGVNGNHDNMSRGYIKNTNGISKRPISIHATAIKRKRVSATGFIG